MLWWGASINVGVSRMGRGLEGDVKGGTAGDSLIGGDQRAEVSRTIWSYQLSVCYMCVLLLISSSPREKGREVRD